jgi:beta-lactamase superfamily II metal-dependent hydrolase
VPFLDYSGISKINCIVISHKDKDHICGIPEVVEYCDVNDVYANDAFFIDVEAYPNGAAKFLETLLNRNDSRIENLKDLSLKQRR